jgi:NAD(P)-dependent dehydrogenase (short-subunit alcohol dehydrogenase family)
VVTGCGRGIGRAILERAVADGYIGIGIELEESLGEALRVEMRPPHEIVIGDVSERPVIQRAANVAASVGGLHGWVNSAGIVKHTSLHEFDLEAVRRVLDVNLHGSYWGCAAAVQQFVSQRSGGAIVNISSVHARAAYCGHAAYDVSKAGVEALTRYVAVEYGRLNIRANAVAPGGVRTPGAAGSLNPADIAAIGRAHPLGRIAEPAEIAGVVSFLLSPDASFMTGHTLVVDGGLSARCWDFELDPKLAVHYGLVERPPEAGRQ